VAGAPCPYFDLAGPKGDRILAVAVPQGGQTWFLKMKGPASLSAGSKPTSRRSPSRCASSEIRLATLRRSVMLTGAIMASPTATADLDRTARPRTQGLGQSSARL